MEVINAMHDAISKLTPRQQEIVNLMYFDGLTQEEIRKKLGIAKSSMSEVFARIHASLKRFYEKN